MPMIVDPDAPLVEPPARVTSPDGYLAAVVDELWAGVVLAYNADTPPSARNLTLNPSVEVDLSNTAVYAGSTRERITTDSRYGAACVKHTATSGTSGLQYLCVAIPAGTPIRVSAWVKVPGTGTTVFFSFRDATTTHGTATAGTPSVTGQWVRMTATYTVPAGKTVDRIAVAYTAPSGTVWYSDAVMIETGTGSPSDYVDGAQPGCAWEGAAHASPSVRVTALPGAAAVRHVRVVRQDPGARAPVPVRSADPAWAIGGVGAAYDHEAPLGVAVIYTATPVYVDGTTGPTSALAVTVPAPPPGPGDVWIKSVDDPGLSVRATVTSWPELSWEARLDSAAVQGSPYPTASQDVYTAAASTITIDAEGDQIEALVQLLTTPGVRLIQTRPDYHRPDQYVLLSGVQQAIDTIPTEARSYQAALTQVGRPATAGQPMRMPGWSYDHLPVRFATSDAVVGSYSSWASLSTDGVT
ncbi:hypothetical protein GTX53_24485 [Streptomyces sp. SID5594]|uniref:hypothetical protein n=1 Tax=unclassified Streptomyces TaxID=2593676 RepID=UPI0003A72347|nr:MULTISPECIES: hypothetical protein [unclassified Streptomyces]MZF56951.1 hypothetical protein [Streptomyces sp. SID5594]